MEQLIKTLMDLIPFLSPYDNWVKGLFAAWTLLTALLIGVLVIKYPPKEAIGDKTVKTGDQVIDSVLAKLNEFEKSQDPIQESRVSDTLKPLVNRSEFIANIHKDNCDEVLYIVFRTRFILDTSKERFKKNPEVRRNISEATKVMTELEKDLAAIYGQAFDITDSIIRYRDNKSAFIDHLPSRIEPSGGSAVFFKDATTKLQSIRKSLEIAGLAEPLP